MNVIRHMRWHPFFLWLVAFALAGCNEQPQRAVELDFDCMISQLDSMQGIIDTARIGEVDGTFPQASAIEFQSAIDELKTGISKAKAGYFVLPFEVNAYCVEATKAISTFYKDRKSVV